MNNINFIFSNFVVGSTWRGMLPSRLAHALGVCLFLTASTIVAAFVATSAWCGWRRAACVCGGISLVSIFLRSTVGVHLVLGCFKVNHCLTSLLRFQRSLLCGTAWHRIKVGTTQQVLEVLTRSKENAYARNVFGGERLAAFRTLAGQRQPEVTKIIQLDFLALQQLFHETAAHVRQYALHLPTLVAAMFGDMRHKLTERHHFLYLRLGVSLRWLAVVNLVGKHVNTVVNHTSAHRRYGTWCLRKQFIAPGRGCYHRTAWQNYNVG